MSYTSSKPLLYSLGPGLRRSTLDLSTCSLLNVNITVFINRRIFFLPRLSKFLSLKSSSMSVLLLSTILPSSQTLTMPKTKVSMTLPEWEGWEGTLRAVHLSPTATHSRAVPHCAVSELGYFGLLSSLRPLLTSQFELLVLGCPPLPQYWNGEYLVTGNSK